MSDQTKFDAMAKDVIRVHRDPTALDGAAWNSLLQQQSRPTPFMRWEYLAALHASGSAVARTGWAPRFVTVQRNGQLVAAAPAYLKSHSYGEYVFDWAWADAYERHGLRYYPKLLVAVPFTPVPGSRLLAADATARRSLLAGLAQVADDEGASSVHLLFHPEDEGPAVAAQGWLARQGVQFHWTQDAAAPHADFQASLPQHWLMFVARRAGQPVATSLVAIDRARGEAYGRYWGATEYVPCLHFEACYYQPLQWCLDQGFVRFEGGAQGEHKMARGLLPVGTQSAHWLAHPQFSAAVADFLQQEGHGIATYDELREHSPFKAGT